MRTEGYSICMTNRNTAPVLATTLRSILDQIPPDTEVIVVDAGSTDGSLGILQSFGGRVRVVEEGPMTRGAGRERAWRLASGDIILQLDCDRPLRPGAFQELVQDLATVRSRHGDAALVSEDLAAYPRWLVERVGGYNVELNYGEDREIYDKMMRLGAMVFIAKYYTTMNWSLEHGRPPLGERFWRVYEMARDIHRVGMGFWTYMGNVRRTRGIAFALATLPLTLLGHLAGARQGKITDSISPRMRTVRP